MVSRRQGRVGVPAVRPFVVKRRLNSPRTPSPQRLLPEIRSPIVSLVTRPQARPRPLRLPGNRVPPDFKRLMLPRQARTIVADRRGRATA